MSNSAAGITATTPVRPAIRPSFEFASTSSASDRTVDGTIADFETAYVFWSTNDPNTNGNSASASSDTAISRVSTTLATDTNWITNRRPPATRSIIGPINGATTRNGAKPSARNNSTRDRAASRSMSKKSESASATTIAASAPIMRAWVTASRRNFDADGRRVDEGTGSTEPILRRE